MVLVFRAICQLVIFIFNLSTLEGSRQRQNRLWILKSIVRAPLLALETRHHDRCPCGHYASTFILSRLEKCREHGHNFTDTTFESLELILLARFSLGSVFSDIF